MIKRGRQGDGRDDWLCWPKSNTTQMYYFKADTFYKARNKAALHFGIDPQSIDGELTPRHVDLFHVGNKDPNHNPWSWMTENNNEQAKPKTTKSRSAKKKSTAKKTAASTANKTKRKAAKRPRRRKR